MSGLRRDYKCKMLSLQCYYTASQIFAFCDSIITHCFSPIRGKVVFAMRPAFMNVNTFQSPIRCKVNAKC